MIIELNQLCFFSGQTWKWLAQANGFSLPHFWKSSCITSKGHHLIPIYMPKKVVLCLLILFQLAPHYFLIVQERVTETLLLKPLEIIVICSCTFVIRIWKESSFINFSHLSKAVQIRHPKYKVMQLKLRSFLVHTLISQMWRLFMLLLRKLLLYG